MARSSKLFEPLKVGSMNLGHRVVMAPLTRFRSDVDHVPILPMVKEYYAQRASVPGTLLVSEATFISPQASGYAYVPGLFTPEQLKAWKVVTDAVHEKGSFIFCQLWALGRAANPSFMTAKGLDVVSSSDIPMSEKGCKPRAATEGEIQQYIEDYARAAKNAVDVAGFDGVEIHGANGYLIDQFTQDVCNQRTDSWGGSVENRARFGLAVAQAVSEAVGPTKTGIRLSPWSTFQAMKMEDPVPQFTFLIRGLKELNLCYLHLVESRIQGGTEVESTDRLDFAFDAWGCQNPVLVAGGYSPKSALTAVDEEYRDKDVAIVFGRHFIANPDLPFRIKEDIQLNKYDRATFYNAQSTIGYTDYPFSAEWEKTSSHL